MGPKGWDWVSRSRFEHQDLDAYPFGKKAKKQSRKKVTDSISRKRKKICALFSHKKNY